MESASDANLVILSGLPVVPQESQHKLNKFILRKLQELDTNEHSKIYIPVDGTGQSFGLAVVRYPTSTAANAGINAHNGTILDQGHTMVVEKLDTSQAFAAAQSQGDVDKQQMQGITALQGWN